MIISLISGQLQYPPKKTKKQLEEDAKKQQAQLRKKKREAENFCTIEELLTGEYLRKKKARDARREKIKAMRRKMELLKYEGYTDDPE